MEKVTVVQKQGLVNSKGEFIIPCEYVSIRVLKSRVYVAEKDNYKDYFTGQNFCFYNSKGKILSDYLICDYEIDEDENIVAIKTALDMWKLARINAEECRAVCRLETLDADLSKILDKSNGYIAAIKKDTDGTEICVIYKTDTWESVFSSDKISDVIISEKGFIVSDKETKKEGFVNLLGKKIIECEWDGINFCSGFIKVEGSLSEGSLLYKIGKYTYDGEEICIDILK